MTRRVVWAAGLVLLLPGMVGLAAQARPQALRKSDLVRLLSGAALTREEIVALVRRNCTSFTPSERDRADLRAVGADDTLLAAIAECRRGREGLRVTLPDGEPSGSAGGTAVVRVALRRGDDPAAGVALVLRGGGLELHATTDARGAAAFPLSLGGGIGERQLTLAAASGERLVGETRVRVAVGPAGPLRAAASPRRVELAATPAGGAPAAVTVAVRDSLGNPVAGRAVQLAARGEGSGSAEDGPAWSRMTNARGEATFPLVAAAFRRDAVLEVRLGPSGGPVLDSVLVLLPGVAAAARTGFVAGLGQRGRVATRAPQPLVFEVRDSLNAPLVGQRVELTAENGRVEAPRDRTDSAGRVSAAVWFGTRAGPVTVTARTGGGGGGSSSLVRQATLVALPGPAATLRVSCGGREVRGRVVLPPDSAVTLRVTAADLHGNPVPPVGLRAAVGDGAVVRVVETTADSASGRVVVRGGRPGSTNLALAGAGLRENLVAAVQGRGVACGG